MIWFEFFRKKIKKKLIENRWFPANRQINWFILLILILIQKQKPFFWLKKKNKKFLMNSINSSLPHRFWFWFIFSDSKCGVRSSFDSLINNGLKFERWMAWFSIKCAILIIRDLVFGFSFEIKFTNTKYHWIYAHYIEQFRFSFSYSFNGFF